MVADSTCRDVRLTPLLCYIGPMGQDNKRRLWSWAFYDWANSAFATTVMAGFFPVFFKQYWAADMAASESTFWLGMANGVSGLVVALAAPFLGAIADQGGLKKGLLIFFTMLGVLMSGGLFLVGHGMWQWAAMLYLLAGIGFSAGNVFYDALLPDVSSRRHLDRNSALGYALGYVGGGLLFAVNVAATLHPDWFGLVDSAQAIRLSFASVALWWLFFSLPLMLWVKEKKPDTKQSIGPMLRSSVRQFLDTFRHIRSLKSVWMFLIAYWLYIDGVGTIARMALDYGLALGFDTSVLITALLITQFVAFPAALVFGRIGERFGARAGIFIGIGVYIVLCVFSIFMREAHDFYWLAAVSGLVMGGVQSLSRSLFATLIPAGQAGEFFGFYNMMGKFAAILGPILMAVVSLATGSNRLSVLAVLLLFVAGGAVLMRVRIEGVREGDERQEAA
ncbi:MAG: MFS transporter [Mariprofundaceae bacterium]|nr:MFS transporter [Mariprofundaceae bacterium]